MELKPCPFCGSSSVGYDKSYKISCRNCSCSVEKWSDEEDRAGNRETVREEWNGRPRIQALIEALKFYADGDHFGVSGHDEYVKDHGNKAQLALNEFETES